MVAAFLTFSFTPQCINAQGAGKFKSAVSKGREFGVPYWFNKGSVFDQHRNDIKEKAKKYGYTVTSIVNRDKDTDNCHDIRVYFIETSELSNLYLEQSFKFLLGRNKNFYHEEYWVNKNLRGRDLKEGGSAYVYEGHELRKLSDVRWTGEVRNGMICGRGDGYASVNHGDLVDRYSFSGSFENGMPIGELNLGICREGHNGWESVYTVNIVKVKQGQTSEGLTVFDINNKKFGFQDNDGKVVIPPVYEEVRSGFSNGLATVKYGSYWLKINKQNKCVEFLPGQDAGNVGNFPRGYFTNDIFSELKTLQVPKCKRLLDEACWFMKSLEEVTFVEGIETIDWRAFGGCKNLKKVTLPNSCTHVASGAFEGCTALETVIVPSTFDLYSNNTFAFNNCPKLKTIYIRMPDGRIEENKEWYDIFQDKLEDLRIENRARNERQKERLEQFREETAQTQELVKKKVNENTIEQYVIKRNVESNVRTYYEFKNITDNTSKIIGFVEHKYSDYTAYTPGTISNTYLGNYKSLTQAMLAIYYHEFNMFVDKK